MKNKILGKNFRNANQLLRSVIVKECIDVNFSVIAYHDKVRNGHLGYCNSEFDFMVGLCFEV